MDDSRKLVDEIVEGIQDKKGKKTLIIDLSKTDNTICTYFVICEGDSNRHVDAIGNSVIDYVNKKIGDKPIYSAGFENANWIALDYMNVIVHIFQREFREFYSLETLWEDGEFEWVKEFY